MRKMFNFFAAVITAGVVACAAAPSMASHGVVNAPWVCSAEDPEFVTEFVETFAEAETYTDFVSFLQSNDALTVEGGNCVIISQVFDRTHVPLQVLFSFDVPPLKYENSGPMVPILGEIPAGDGNSATFITVVPVSVLDEVFEEHGEES